MAENGLFIGSADSTPYRTAAEQYQRASDAPSAADALRMEALLRLGGLYARGLMVAAGSTVQPEPEKAYSYFKQAADIDPTNALAKAVLEETGKQLKPDQITKANAAAEQMEKDREAKKQAAAAGQPSPAAAATAASPAPAASAPAATPATPATTPATPASPTTPATDTAKKPSGGFRIPGLGR